MATGNAYITSNGTRYTPSKTKVSTGNSNLPTVSVPYVGDMAYDAKNDNFWKGNTPIQGSALGEYVNSRVPEANAPYANFGKLSKQQSVNPSAMADMSPVSMNFNGRKFNYDADAGGGTFEDTGAFMSNEGMQNMANNNSFWNGSGFNVGDKGGSGFMSGLGEGISNWWGGLDSGGKIGAATGGASALANLWNSYNQQKYADKAAKLQDRAQSFYEQQLNRQNQRQDQAQANYEASFR